MKTNSQQYDEKRSSIEMLFTEDNRASRIPQMILIKIRLEIIKHVFVGLQGADMTLKALHVQSLKRA